MNSTKSLISSWNGLGGAGELPMAVKTEPVLGHIGKAVAPSFPPSLFGVALDSYRSIASLLISPNPPFRRVLFH